MCLGRVTSGPRVQARAPSVLTLEILEHHVGHAGVGVVVEVEHLDDVRMAERARNLGLALEALERVAIADHLGIQDLDGEAARQPEVRRRIHRAHAARAEQPLEAIDAPQHLPDQGIRHRMHPLGILHGYWQTASESIAYARTRAAKWPPSLSGVVWPVAPAPNAMPAPCAAATSSGWSKK